MDRGARCARVPALMKGWMRLSDETAALLNSWAVSKVDAYLPCNPSTPSSGIYPSAMEIHAHRVLITNAVQVLRDIAKEQH